MVLFVCSFFFPLVSSVLLQSSRVAVQQFIALV